MWESDIQRSLVGIGETKARAVALEQYIDSVFRGETPDLGALEKRTREELSKFVPRFLEGDGTFNVYPFFKDYNIGIGVTDIPLIQISQDKTIKYSPLTLKSSEELVYSLAVHKEFQGMTDRVQNSVFGNIDSVAFNENMAQKLYDLRNRMKGTLFYSLERGISVSIMNILTLVYSRESYSHFIARNVHHEAEYAETYDLLSSFFENERDFVRSALRDEGSVAVKPKAEEIVKLADNFTSCYRRLHKEKVRATKSLLLWAPSSF